MPSRSPGIGHPQKYMCIFLFPSIIVIYQLLSLAFQAPGSPAGMNALLEHSVQSYRPLPSDLRSRRVRILSLHILKVKFQR